MRYRAYPEYKESGIEWFGQCPAHWQRYRLKWTVESLRNGVWGSEPSGEDDLYCIRVADFDRVQLKTSAANLTLRSVDKKDRTGRLLSKGDLLLEKSGGGDKQLVGVVVEYTLNDAAVCSNFVAAMTTASSIHNRYLAYLHAHLYSSRVNYRSIKQSTGIQNLDAQMYFDEQVIYPKHDEQGKIAEFLDHKTAQIDRLIEKKQELIEKVQEQRITIIAQAVTKGLHASTSSKESDVEWIGETPAHWTVCKLSFRYSVDLGKMLDEKKITGDYLVPYLRNQDVQWGEINTENLPEMDIHPPEATRFTVKAGDLLVCEGGDIGRAAIWRHDNISVGYQKALHRLRPYSQESDTTEFFYFSLIAAKHRGAFDESDTKATIAHLPAEKFRQFRFAFPPFNEQILIAQHLRAKTERLDTMLMNIQNVIARLHEYRTALITAAVTGQIDVRDWQAPEPTKEPADKEVA